MSINGIKNLKVTGQRYLCAYNKSNGTNYTSILQTKKVVPFISKEELKYALINDIYQENAQNKNFFVGVGKIFNKVKSFFAPKYPEFLQEILGENRSITRDFSDFGGFYSSRMLFKRKSPHLIAIDTTKSNWKQTVKTQDISCLYDKKGDLERVLVFNWPERDVSVFNKQGELLRSYSPEETHALFNYKSDSKLIHRVLREKNLKGVSEHILRDIEALKRIFTEGKTDVLEENKIVYRALDRKALKAIKEAKEDVCVYEEPSFLSVATKKSGVFQFLNLRNFNHILELEIPAGTPILKMDEVGHIIVPQVSENELVLNAGQRILIDKSSGKLKGKLI